MKLEKKNYLLLIFGIVIIDKVIKYYLLQQKGMTIINENIGLSISIPLWAFVLMSSLIIISLYKLLREESKLLWFLLVAGVLANISDRFIWGGVVDYIRIPEVFIFNMSDLLIVVCLFLILIKFLQLPFQCPKSLNLMK